MKYPVQFCYFFIWFAPVWVRRRLCLWLHLSGSLRSLEKVGGPRSGSAVRKACGEVCIHWSLGLPQHLCGSVVPKCERPPGIKKQLSFFSSLPSLCTWISFCKSLFGFVRACAMKTKSKGPLHFIMWFFWISPNIWEI